MTFELRFPEKDIAYWASRNKSDLSEMASVGGAARSRGFLRKSEFLQIALVKSPRSKSRCKSNSETFVREVTRISLAAESEQVEIQALTMLCGVAWPTASYILHFCSRRAYPVLDFRALWSVSVPVPSVYNFPFWKEYTQYCRAVAKRNEVSMHTLDSALWQFSKENQNT